MWLTAQSKANKEVQRNRLPEEDGSAELLYMIYLLNAEHYSRRYSKFLTYRTPDLKSWFCLSRQISTNS